MRPPSGSAWSSQTTRAALTPGSAHQLMAARAAQSSGEVPGPNRPVAARKRAPRSRSCRAAARSSRRLRVLPRHPLFMRSRIGRDECRGRACLNLGDQDSQPRLGRNPRRRRIRAERPRRLFGPAARFLDIGQPGGFGRRIQSASPCESCSQAASTASGSHPQRSARRRPRSSRSVPRSASSRRRRAVASRLVPPPSHPLRHQPPRPPTIPAGKVAPPAQRRRDRDRWLHARAIAPPGEPRRSAARAGPETSAAGPAERLAGHQGVAAIKSSDSAGVGHRM